MLRQTLPGRGSCVIILRFDLREGGGGEFSLEDFDSGPGFDIKWLFNFTLWATSFL